MPDARPLPSPALLPLLGALGACGLQSFPIAKDTGGPALEDGGEAGDGGDGGGPTDTGLTGGDGGGGGADGGADGADGGTDGGADGAEGGGDGGEDPKEPLAITAVSPSYGYVTGGQVVTVTGGPFDATAAVQIGGALATVSAWTPTQLTVTTPPASRPAGVRVTVETDTHEGSLSDGYTYYADGRGYTGLVGYVEYAESIGGYWESSFTYGGALAIFVEPDQDLAFWQFTASGIDTCANDASFSPTISAYVEDPGVASLTLRPNSGSALTLPADGTGGYATTSLSPSQFVDGATWQLDALSGSSLPALAVPSVARALYTPSISSPAMTGTTAPNIARNFAVRWTPSGASWVQITTSLENGYGTDGWETVTCVAADDGNFSVQTSLFTSWPSGVVVNIAVSNVFDTPGGTLPWNGADARIATYNTVVGGGWSTL